MKKKPIAFGYNYLPPGHPNNPKSFSICGARTKQKTSNPLCLNPAGFRTYHRGVGRCYLHGGSSPMGPDHPRWKAGKYAYLFRGRLKEHLKNIHIEDPNPTDLLPELEVQRTLLLLALERIGRPGYDLSSQDYRLISDITNTIVKTVSKIVWARNQSAFTKTDMAWIISKFKEGMDIFVSKEKQGPYLEWIKSQIPGVEE